MPKVTTGDKQVAVVRGSSCWFTNGTGQCVDTIKKGAGLYGNYRRDIGFVKGGWIDNLDEDDPEIVYFKRIT
jgi:hypothetical protein